MKKMNARIAALLSASALAAVLFTGCAQASADSSKADSLVLYPSAEKSASSQVTPAPTSASTTPAATAAPAATSSTTAAPASEELLSEEEARRIVLEHAGLTEDQVTFVTFEMDRGRYRTEYDLEFYAGSEEYDYEIDAATGEILSFDRDMEGHAPVAPAQSGELLSADQAQSAALTHAGLTADQVVGMRSELDRDDGRQLYEVEFYSGTTEYDYEIDAYSGEVIGYSAERD